MQVTHMADVGEAVTNGRWRAGSRHMRHVCRKLMEVELGLNRRLVVQMPPRHGKTTSCGLIFPFHYLTLYPWREVMYVTHSSDLAAERGELLRDLVRDAGQGFGFGVSEASKAKDDFDLVDLDGRRTGGSVRCFGVGAGIHGRGAHLIVLDDLFKDVDEALSPVLRDARWRKYTSSLHTRLAPGGSVVSIGTPLHEDDWFGRARRAEADGGEAWDWTVLRALAEGDDDPLGRKEGEALWPEGGWTVEELGAKRDAMTVAGNYRDWRAQYELEPLSGDGVTEWPDRYFEDLLRPFQYTEPWWTSCLAIDTSKGARAQKRGDWQAFVHASAASCGHVRLECDLCRLDVKGLRDKALDLIRRWAPRNVVVETNGAGYALLEDLWERGVPALGRNHTSAENKVVRITQRIGRALEAGILHFDPSPGSKLTVEQARLFPHAKYDDGIDAAEMALEFIGELRLEKHQRRVRYQTRIAA